MRALAGLVICGFLVPGSQWLPTLDTTSDAAVDRSFERMTEKMTKEEREALQRDISTALHPARLRCGLGYSRPDRGFPYAQFLKPLHGRTADEIRDLAATARREEKARQDEMARLRLELTSLRDRIAALEAEREALKPLVQHSRLAASGAGGEIEVAVHNHTSRPIAAARFRAVKCCGPGPRDWLTDAFVHRPARPLAPGAGARWTLTVPQGSPILKPGQVPNDFFGVTCELLEGPGGVRLHEFVYETAATLERQRWQSQDRLSRVEAMRVGLAR